MLPAREPLHIKRHAHSESKGMKKDMSCKWKQTNAGVAIFIWDKIDFQTRAVTRDKEGHFIIMKVSIQEDITLINTYAPT